MRTVYLVGAAFALTLSGAGFITAGYLAAIDRLTGVPLIIAAPAAFAALALYERAESNRFR